MADMTWHQNGTVGRAPFSHPIIPKILKVFLATGKQDVHTSELLTDKAQVWLPTIALIVAVVRPTFCLT